MSSASVVGDAIVMSGFDDDDDDDDDVDVVDVVVVVVVVIFVKSIATRTRLDCSRSSNCTQI